MTALVYSTELLQTSWLTKQVMHSELLISDNTKRRAVLPNEKQEFSAGWRAAQKGRLKGYTTGLASGLHIKAGRRAAH